ncbi:hypothetical protein DQ04_01631090 [Trypanosoma grayi]|uniref:hypothetical protein n=1 Tax=Trypanosoma grayi TaxID=71804 RepID=UPI0004F3FC5C|nr:hypothetical protein DQ04_01631090 [Trypanosoma grayi]KEG12543.1 hypothetical protein DQ04_01631090 [Trypanosoma grayi]
MARGRRPAVAPAKRVTKKVPVDTSSSIAEALRQASADGDDDGVVLVCRKVAGRRGRTAADKPGSLSQRQDCRLHLQPTAPDVSFWKGVCRHTTLVQALANIGTLVEAEPTLLFASPHPRYPFSALSVDRLRTAIQAVVDANFILQSTYGGDSKPVSPSDSLHKKWEIVRKLVQLSEAAVPMKTSVLKYAAMTSNGNMSTSNSAEVLVPPTTPWALQDRLQRLKRLWQLRECQVHIISELRLCKTKRDVAVALLGPSMDASNTVEPLPGMSSWHQREQSLIKGLVDQVNDDSPCSESWGAPFAPALRVSGGSYVLQRRFRSEALVSLLEAAEFFGLPPFLRSIRVSGGRARPFSLQAAPTVTPMEVGGTAHSVEEPLPYFFPLPCDLDPRCYEVPPPGQAKLVQEELIDLACRHCRFGALVGEADQVLALLHASAAYRQRVKAEQVALKSELAESDRAPGVGAGPGEDPLLAYAQLLATAAQEGSKKEGEVHWLCGNHWSSTMSYYALVLAAVPPHTRGEEAEEQEDIDGDECAARRSDDATTLYYVAAVLELTRS